MSAESEAKAHAARLGMWTFLASEVLLFSVLFALYATYRAHSPAAFHTEIHDHADKLLGSVNTAVLLVSSTLAALAVHALREGKRSQSRALCLTTAALGVVFLAIKSTEYAHHFGAHLRPGQVPFWTLYFTMTGLHALHVTAGIVCLVIGAFTPLERAQRLENIALYWHLVDVIWIFLWPLFYLA